ncbi:hypothetical protein [Chryseobacterium sp. Leaf394]|uniref:DUF6922 domain-containing protein n=1 Tax=Chryseobacterium sp. Leaf394 TaxID=1736361 RepID=UPI0006FA0578|nr:hypothetical protein [Chryseobacterium sp. Leaf394]KQS92017.1 hypothetical protein ASG21_06065 [Chryseobacterium sp. Leaf394]
MQKSSKLHPDFSKIPRFLFWDTDFDGIDWEKKYVAVIKRVFERGSDEAKSEIEQFYGKELVTMVLNSKSTKPMHLHINK